MKLFFGKDENYELTCKVPPDLIKTPLPSLMVMLSPEGMVKVTPGFIVKTAPESIVMETPDRIVTSEVKIVFSKIIHGSSILPDGGLPV